MCKSHEAKIPGDISSSEVESFDGEDGPLGNSKTLAWHTSIEDNVSWTDHCALLDVDITTNSINYIHPNSDGGGDASG